MFEKLKANAIFRFLLSSGISAGITYALPMVLHYAFGISERTAVGIAFACAYLFNFMSLRKLVFNSDSGWKSDLIRYAVVNGAFRVGEYYAFIAIREWTPLPYPVALFVVLLLSTAVKFFAYRATFNRPAGRSA